MPLTVLKTLSKNLQVVQALRERQAREEAEVQARREHQEYLMAIQQARPYLPTDNGSREETKEDFQASKVAQGYFPTSEVSPKGSYNWRQTSSLGYLSDLPSTKSALAVPLEDVGERVSVSGGKKKKKKKKKKSASANNMSSIQDVSSYYEGDTLSQASIMLTSRAEQLRAVPGERSSKSLDD